MCAALKASCDTHNSVWSSFAGFATPYNDFVTLYGQIPAALALQAKSSTGTTEQKAQLRLDLMSQMRTLSDALVFYFHSENNLQAKDDAYMTNTDISRCDEESLLGRAFKLKSLIPTPIPTGLSAAPLTINALFVTNFEAAMDAFSEAIGTPRHIIVESSRGTEELEMLIEQMHGKLELMDMAAQLYRNTQPIFYSEYSKSRLIIDAGNITRALTVTVYDKATNEPLQDAQATINPGGISKLSGSQGMFYIQSLAEGIYILEVSKAGFNTESVKFVIDKVGGVVLDVHLSI